MHIQTSDQEVMELGFGGYSCNWGLHICGLYESEEERDEIVFGYLNRGDRDGDLQLYCPAERGEEEFHRQYEESFPECTGHSHDRDRFRLLSPRSLYYPEGTFDPRAMSEGLESFYADSQAGGKRNVRATSEMVWALESVPGIEHLMVYESKLNDFIPGKPWASVCLYNVNRFSGDIILNALRTHPYAISGGLITRNPFYQDPDQWLSEHAPEFLESHGE